MAGWEHPRLGLIAPIPELLAPKKVWRHFYAPQERWGSLCGVDIARARATVEARLRVSRADVQELPFVSQMVWPEVARLLTRDHVQAYAPCYWREVSHPETRWTPNMDRQWRHRALTPNSVFVIVELGSPSWLVTAYRPHPPLRDVVFCDEDFRRSGEYELERAHQAMLSRDAVIRELRRATAAHPQSAQDLWWLCLAVGHARLLLPALDADRAAGERALSQAPHALREALGAALDWDGAVEDVSGGLRVSRLEEVEAGLSRAEDLIVVGETLGVGARAARLLEALEPLLAWLPAEWDHLAIDAERRLAIAGDGDGALGRLWAQVSAAVTGALFHESAAPASPPARLAAEVVAEAVRRRQPLWIALSRVLARPAEGVLEIFEACRFAVAGPVPVLGQERSWAEAHSLRGRRPDRAEHLRLFVMEDGAEPFDATQYLLAGADLWNLERPGDRVWLILFTADAPIEGASLAEVVALAEGRADVRAVERRISRSS